MRGYGAKSKLLKNNWIGKCRLVHLKNRNPILHQHPGVSLPITFADNVTWPSSKKPKHWTEDCQCTKAQKLWLHNRLYLIEEGPQLSQHHIHPLNLLRLLGSNPSRQRCFGEQEPEVLLLHLRYQGDESCLFAWNRCKWLCLLLRKRSEEKRSCDGYCWTFIRCTCWTSSARGRLTPMPGPTSMKP